MHASLTGRPVRAGDVILAAEGLTKDFRGFTAVKNVDLRVHAGSVHALIGPNGAGKTTVFNLLTKFLQPTRGRIVYRGEDITRAGAARVAQMGLVRSFQISAVFPHLTLLDNVRVALHRPRHMATQWWRSMTALSALNDLAMELLDMVQLADHADLKATELSYGRKRALEVGTNLIIIVFAVVGGMGSILGAVVTGYALGLIEGLTKVFYPEASSIVIFVVMALVLLVRPAGLFGREA